MLQPDALVLNGRFRLLRPLAQGGMGEVFLAEQVSLGRKVALKVLKGDLRQQPGMAERFRREARLLSSVDHPAVVRVVEYGEEEGQSVLVMEYVEGRTLESALAPGPLPPPRAVPLLVQLAEGLAAIHSAGIVHRDLKPENVVLSPLPAGGEQARLLDFGIARLAEASADSALSQVGVVLGTPEYLSPEQAMGHRVDFRSDVYSFGLLAYRCLTGGLPFAGPTPRAFLSQHVHAPPRAPEEAWPALRDYPSLCALLLRCLEKDPTRRPASARALAEALAAPALLERVASPTRRTPAEGVVALAAGAEPVRASGTLQMGAGSSGTGPQGTRAGEALAALADVAPSAPPHATAAFGAAGAPLVALPGRGATGAMLAPESVQNLTVMLTDIAGFTAQTSLQTREENARMLETHDRLLLPLVRRHGGRLVQKRGDALLVSFPSPTDAVHCGMAIQDRLWRHNAAPEGAPVVRVRVVLHAGDVLVDGERLVGEPLEVLEQVEKQASAGEVVFTEAVNLARNRAEAAAEEHGYVVLPGGHQLRLYRCRSSAEGAPFGGRDRPQKAALLSRVRPTLPSASGLLTLPRRAAAGLVQLPRHAWTAGRARLLALPPRVRLAVVGGLAVVLVAATVGHFWYHSTGQQVRRLLAAGEEEAALALVDEAVREGGGVDMRVLRAVVLHARNRHREELAELRGLTEEERHRVGEEAVRGLAEDFGRGERNSALRDLLAVLPADTVNATLLPLAREESSYAQWGALRFLDLSERAAELDLVERYIRALEAKPCAMRSVAARRLGELGGLKALAPLTRLKESPRDTCGREEAAAALRILERKP